MGKRLKTIKKVDLEEPETTKRVKSITKESKIKGLDPYVLEMVIYVFVILLLSCGTYWRNEIWNNPVELWTDCTKKSPNKDRPHLMLGTIFIGQGKYQEAIDQFTEALRINPDLSLAHYNLGIAYLAIGGRNPALREYEILKTKNPRLANALYEKIK